MQTPFRIALFLLIIFFALLPDPARADGIIIPEPPPCEICPPPPCPGPQPCPLPSPIRQLAIRYHRVTVSIQDQVATTHIDQVFHNPNNWPVEGTYIFPLPAGATVSTFKLWIDDRPVDAQIMDAGQARRTYRQIVSSLRDPALLEYAGEGAVQAQVFPIPPAGDRRIELEYTQALPAENGLVRYVYPLSTEKFSVWPLEQVSINVDIRANVPIRAAYSPSHTVDISRESENHVRAGYEASQVTPDADFALYYSLGEQQALHLLSYRDPTDQTDPDGFFLLLLAPRPEARQEALPKDVLLVLDRSGSMEGEKFQQAQDALRYILNHLNEKDRFNIIAFSTGLESYASGPRPASEADQALGWVDRLSALGSTDINRALLEAAAMADKERPTYLIFLTDGLPTEGVVDSAHIIENFASQSPAALRLFAFGVGYDVDTFLLDSLAQAHHGATNYVLPGERLDEILSTFYAKISTPVLTDLELDFASIPVYDLYPSPIPDLFSGSQIILVGRYRQGGETTITLSGTVDDQRQSMEFSGQVFTGQSSGAYPQSVIPRLWATRKIGHLLNRIRLKGPDQETIDQIVRLSIRYGIVTPYTSYLVTENRPLGVEEQQRIAKEAYNQLRGMPAAPASGQAAVEKAADLGQLEGAQSALSPAESASGDSGGIRVVGSRTFLLDGETWVDTAFDFQNMKPVEVAFLSDDYFALADSRPELAAAFALGSSVIAIADGRAYQVIPAGETPPPVEIPATRAPATSHPAAPNAGLPTSPEADRPTAPPAETTSRPATGTYPCAAALLPLAFAASLTLAHLRPRARS